MSSHVLTLAETIGLRLSIWFRWTNLRSLSNSYATKSAVLIPVVGYLLIFSNALSEWLNISNTFGGGSSHGVSTRLLLVYFGLCFIAAGNVLYGFFCPQEVKDYPSANSYIKGDGDSIQQTALEEIEDELKDTDFGSRLEEVKAKYLMSVADLSGEEKNDLLRLYFNFLNTRHRRIRITSSIAYIVGFFFLGISSLQVFGKVVLLLISSTS